MPAQTPFKMARVGGEALPLAKELIEEFKAKGYRASLAGVVEAGLKVSTLPRLRRVSLAFPCGTA